MIDPLETLKLRFSLLMVKDDWPLPWPLEILKFRFSLHMVKDDWPPRNFKVLDFVCTLSKMIDAPEILELRFSLHMVKEYWPPTPRNFKV